MTAPMPLSPEPVLLFDRSARLRMQFTGPKAAESLTGLVTNDVLGLRGGDGLYACALTAKGRIIADVRILALPPTSGAVESLLVDANASGGVGFAAMIRKYVNPRLARYTDVTGATTCLTLTGSAAVALLQSAGAEADAIETVGTGAAFTHRGVSVAGAEVRIVRAPDLGDRLTLDLHVAAEHGTTLRDALVAAGATPADDAEWHRLRVMAARPEWGVDMDETTLAQEANMDALQAISYRKGCYTGQETVARVHFRGHVNRTLRRIRCDGVLPPVGSALTSGDATVGDTRSVALDDSGAGIGIAMVRREVADAAVLTWHDADGTRHEVTVVGVADES
jgi:tRNA-modifying protein YgfZ